MKNFDSRTYSINDFVEWQANDQLELSPRYQRKAVWSEGAKSYLLDTIIRGKPIPKVFIRQKINPRTKKSVREVVDGQQRLRAILSFVKDGFVISKRHNKQYGGLFFSQLDTVDPDIASNILNYEISVDLLVNMDDVEILDVFSRLNSYAITLNEQEKLNANHFGDFKILTDRIAFNYNNFWIQNRIVTEQQVLRMNDAQLVADILIAITDGVREKKQISKYYTRYEESFPFDADELASRFDECIQLISCLFPETLKNTEFRRVHLFYSLFVSVYHIKYGVKNLNELYRSVNMGNLDRLRNGLEKIEEIIREEDKTVLTKEQLTFLTDCQRATTDAAVRIRRSSYILKMMSE
ncbi:DUF262 domain-containing protein [Planctopirus hydrillae]|uniref:GmrSD restriction endonucleases N-terminal domain-containing protein n=1 Tax=Planctopirus hydrillae TaxID=1841610 RepID=A0A1C3E9Q1_9PLAN|nr:DUF262 domain-containing protein [Planctopirus hydrillae]ODA29951.1 hypothetical protein A6X21_06310 [Planctopirus hydrillae]